MHLPRRRDFVARLGMGAGACLLAPIARGLIGQARGEVLPPRFILFQDSQGWDEYRYAPAGDDLRSAALNPAMKPLGPWQDRMLILDQFYNLFNVGLHGNDKALLSMEPSPLEDPEGVDSGSRHPKFAGVTIDRFVARVLSKGLPFQSLNFSIQGGVASADGPDQPVASHRNPVRAYDAIFAGFVSEDLAKQRASFQARRRTLDLVKDDVKRLASRLATPERIKLDQYLHSIDTLDGKVKRLAESGGKTCETGTKPAAALDREQKKYQALDLEVIETLTQMAVTALLCGQTNVLGLTFTPSRGNYVFLGNSRDKHDTQHNAFKGEGGQGARSDLVRIDDWHAGMMAKVFAQLAAVPESSGTVLDQTLALWINTGGGKHHTGNYKDNGKPPTGGVVSHPVVLLGNPTGRLKQTGRFVRYRPLEHSLADVYVTVANALGLPIESFGRADVNRGPLPGLI